MNGFEWNWADLNWLAVIVGMLSIMVVSSVWYLKPVFGGMWMEDSGVTQDQFNENMTPLIFLPIAVAALISVIGLALFINNIGGGPAEGLLTGAVAGALISVPAQFPHYAFAMRPTRLMLINSGQTVVTLAIVGLILGAWR